MRRRLTVTCGILLAIQLLTHTSVTSAAEELGDLLRESKWDRVIGTWVDADTQGQNLRLTYAWKIKDRVLESTSKEPDKETVALIGVNGKSGEVFQVSADSEGTSTLGSWQLAGDGDAVLGLLYTTGDGQEGGLKIRYHFESDDELLVTIDLPDPIVVRMVRKK